MAPSRTTTTLRVPTELRDEIARIARQRNTSMIEVVTDAVRRLGRDQWWSTVRDALDELSPQVAADRHAERRQLDGTAPDGLDGR